MADFGNGQNCLITGTVVGQGISSTFDVRFPYSRFTIQITPMSGNATVHTSLDGTNWVEWDNGSVAATSMDTCQPVCYIRVTNTSSTSTTVSIWGSC